MPEPFLGEVRIFAGNFAPQGWAFCNGQILPIGSYTALFSLLGTTYGGNGTSTFALPNFQGRIPLHQGQGPGLSPRSLGESAGAETHTLVTSQLPLHTHSMTASSGNGVSDSAAGKLPAANAAAIPQYAPTANADQGAAAAGSSGGGQAHNNMAPYLCLSYIIALQGIFPSRP